MDKLAVLVEEMHLTGGIFLDAEFTAPWCVTARVGPEDYSRYVPAPRSIVAFHYVSRGRLQLEVDDHPPVPVDRGEIVLLPRNDVHRLGDRLDIPAVDADSLIKPGKDGGLAQIRYGGGGEETQVICGFLGTDRAKDPLLSMLPPVLKVKIEEEALGAWIESSFKLEAREMAAGTVRSPEMLTRLAELLFKETISRFVASLPPGPGRWQDGLRDPKIASALALVHTQLRRHWTAEQLAAEVGMSRSAFADRFTRLIGEPPMRYVARQRLQVAAEKLRHGKDSIARIAFDVGYESEAAFNRAFKREFGVPPATWRREVSRRPQG